MVDQRLMATAIGVPMVRMLTMRMATARPARDHRRQSLRISRRQGRMDTGAPHGGAEGDLSRRSAARNAAAVTGHGGRRSVRWVLSLTGFVWGRNLPAIEELRRARQEGESLN